MNDITDTIEPLAAKTGSPASPQGQVREAQLRWNDKNMVTNFANVVNVQSTREQVDLFFGTNQTWNIARGHRGERRPHQSDHLDPVRSQAAVGGPGRRAA